MTYFQSLKQNKLLDQGLVRISDQVSYQIHDQALSQVWDQVWNQLWK